jgi:hypothetical protein
MSESHVLTADSLQNTARVQQESPFLTDNTDALKAYQKNTYTKFRSFLHTKPPCCYPGRFSLQVISQHPAKYQPTNLFQGLIILLVTEGIPKKPLHSKLEVSLQSCRYPSTPGSPSSTGAYAYGTIWYGTTDIA